MMTRAKRSPSQTRNTQKKRSRSKKRRLLHEQQNGMCKYCEQEVTLAEATLDHVRPRSMGGTNELSNLVLACPTCNVAKGDKWGNELDAWLVLIRKVR